MKVLLFVTGALLSLALGCGQKQNEPASTTNRVGGRTTPAAVSSQTAASNRTFVVKGVIKKMELAAKSVTIQHEEIPDFMMAMTMPFRVKDTNELSGLNPGDAVQFRLTVTEDRSWIDQIRKQETASAPPVPETKPPEREAFRVVRDVQPLKVGDVMPNYRFTNELGQVVNLSDFKGQALAFTFIFTRCPMPEFCPRMSRNFQDVYQKLSARAGGPTNWHLLSISFDPHFDTPAVLRGYAQAFQADPKRWNFVTGAMIDIDAITDQFELTIVKRGNDWDHKIRTVVVDADGRIQQIIWGNEWKPDALVEEMVKAAQVRPAEPPR